MEDRGFNEVDLRTMLEQASNYQRDAVEKRWVIETVTTEDAGRSSSNRMAS